MKLVKAYNSVSLVLRIVIGMVIGAALALLIPNAAVTGPASAPGQRRSFWSIFVTRRRYFSRMKRLSIRFPV